MRSRRPLPCCHPPVSRASLGATGACRLRSGSCRCSCSADCGNQRRIQTHSAASDSRRHQYSLPVSLRPIMRMLHSPHHLPPPDPGGTPVPGGSSAACPGSAGTRCRCCCPPGGCCPPNGPRPGPRPRTVRAHRRGSCRPRESRWRPKRGPRPPCPARERKRGRTETQSPCTPRSPRAFQIRSAPSRDISARSAPESRRRQSQGSGHIVSFAP
mmetsp:Transcript_22252/g.56179  ORF Transcript_22252/g.56179 Transcript_22252/m.56179 type:complete len:213 (+) Transcript_22252:400-1038(+)